MQSFAPEMREGYFYSKLNTIPGKLSEEFLCQWKGCLWLAGDKQQSCNYFFLFFSDDVGIPGNYWTVVKVKNSLPDVMSSWSGWTSTAVLATLLPTQLSWAWVGLRSPWPLNVTQSEILFPRKISHHSAFMWYWIQSTLCITRLPFWFLFLIVAWIEVCLLSAAALSKTLHSLQTSQVISECTASKALLYNCTLCITGQWNCTATVFSCAWWRFTLGF